MTRCLLPLLALLALPTLLLACEGPSGPAGTPASPPDPAEVAAQLLDDPAFVAALASRMRADPDLAEQLRGPMGEPGEAATVEPGPGGWVLRDRDGVRVAAAVVPRHIGEDLVSAPVWPLGAPAPPPHDCARVRWFEGKWYNALYSMSTGRMEDCHENHSDLRLVTDYDGGSGGLIWTDPGCQGKAFASAGLDTASFVQVSGEMLYASRETPRDPELDGQIYRWDATAGECIEATQPGDRRELKPVQQGALDLLPNAPYTIAWEH